MTRTSLPLITLDVPPPAGSVIPAAWLDLQLQRQAEHTEANQSAETILKAAGRKAQAIVRRARKTERLMLHELDLARERMRDETIKTCEVQWIAAHVKQLQQQQTVEHALIDAVSQRIMACCEHVLSAWCAEQSVDQILLARLTKQVQRMAKSEALTLRIAPHLVEEAAALFADRLSICPDPQLPADRAILSSTLLSVDISLSRHLQHLLAWLRHTDSVEVSNDAE